MMKNSECGCKSSFTNNISKWEKKFQLYFNLFIETMNTTFRVRFNVVAPLFMCADIVDTRKS